MNENKEYIPSQETLDKIDGIELLVDWAKEGKIDPWNIDLVQVTDMFLEKIAEIKHNNLRLTGRTLFFAAVLLKLKSDYLEGIDPLKIMEPEPEENLFEFDEDQDTFNIDENVRKANIASVENAIARRTSIRKNRTRQVTLEDLIKQLRELEEIEHKKSLKATEERIKSRRSYTHFTPDDIIEMAHDEYIEDEILKLQDLLTNFFNNDEKIGLNDLVKAGMNRVSAYIALLFLSSRSQIDLVQDEFYSDLYVVREVS